MIRWNTLRWLAAIILLAGCNTNERHSVLDAPPFASITDSIEKFPKRADLLLRRAELLSQHNEHELAYRDFRDAYTLDSSEYVTLSYISNLFLINKPNEAVELLESGTRRFPDNPDFRRRLSEAYIQTGRSNEALAQYDNMLQTDSLNFETWYEKGMLLVELNDTAAAIDALARSYSLQPLTMNGLALANLYAETKNPMALTIADDLIRKDSLVESLDPVYIKGVYYSNTRQYPQALEQFEKCIRADWKFTDAYIEKGIILYEQKNIDEALLTFKMAATVTPSSP
ncbi:MAG TPA: tetratricopeptide repeat protein, partial [Chitinophagaceae bacterium]|nr:tetratricopeptide repeat protein [Chitinophagaceae bacterium]